MSNLEILFLVLVLIFLFGKQIFNEFFPLDLTSFFLFKKIILVPIMIFLTSFFYESKWLKLNSILVASLISCIGILEILNYKAYTIELKVIALFLFLGFVCQLLYLMYLKNKKLENLVN